MRDTASLGSLATRVTCRAQQERPPLWLKLRHPLHAGILVSGWSLTTGGENGLDSWRVLLNPRHRAREAGLTGASLEHGRTAKCTLHIRDQGASCHRHLQRLALAAGRVSMVDRPAAQGGQGLSPCAVIIFGLASWCCNTPGRESEARPCSTASSNRGRAWLAAARLPAQTAGRFMSSGPGWPERGPGREACCTEFGHGAP